MNFVGDSSGNISFVNFNQDCTSLAIGTKIGYKLLALTQVDKLEPPIYENEKDDVRIVERLFSSSLVAIVNVSTPRKLKICHFKKGTEICNYSYSNTILAVKLNRARLVVCLEESLYIHNIRDMKVLHTIRETPPNPHGLCALSVSTDNCFLAYPGNTAIGEVQIFDADTLAAKVMIPAHDNPLAALAFNVSGNKIATASDKGTVIRVFGVQDGAKLYEFRRGVKRCVTIYSLAFSADSLFLCASSNTETVHIFKLEDQREDSKQLEEPQGWMGYFGKALQSSAGYLPTQVTDMLNQGRDFASIHLPFTNIRTICAIVMIQKVFRVMVVSADGYIYFYNLDPLEGGDCTLVKQHKLDGTPDANTSSSSDEQTTGDKPAGGVPGGPSYASTVRKTEQPAGTIYSYADVVLGYTGLCPETSEAEKIRDLTTATAETGGGGATAATNRLNSLKLDDDTEFPPMT